MKILKFEVTSNKIEFLKARVELEFQDEDIAKFPKLYTVLKYVQSVSKVSKTLAPAFSYDPYEPIKDAKIEVYTCYTAILEIEILQPTYHENIVSLFVGRTIRVEMPFQDYNWIMYHLSNSDLVGLEVLEATISKN